MELGIKGRAAVVAAASQGLGYACARELAREGASVVICSRDHARITDAARRIRAEFPGATVRASVVDISKEGECIDFVNEAAAALGKLDILVTNSGGPAPGSFDHVALEDVRRGIDSTMMSALALMSAAIPHLRANGWGRIVNILSSTVKQPRANLLLSNTLRPGILGFAKSISLEMASQGITVNNVAPGFTKTERLDEVAEHAANAQNVDKAAVLAEWERAIPARRLGRPEDLAAVVAFLCSERASYVTGVTIQVDGGAIQSLL